MKGLSCNTRTPCDFTDPALSCYQPPQSTHTGQLQCSSGGLILVTVKVCLWVRSSVCAYMSTRSYAILIMQATRCHFSSGLQQVAAEQWQSVHSPHVSPGLVWALLPLLFKSFSIPLTCVACLCFLLKKLGVFIQL